MTAKVPETVLSEREVSQGIKLGHMRYVLTLSLVLCAAAGTLSAITAGRFEFSIALDSRRRRASVTPS
jgi:hypothetical protein